MKKISILLLLLIASGTAIRAQLNFFFLPEVYGRSIDGIGNFQVQNISTEVAKGQIIILVKENNSNTEVVTILTPVQSFNPGMNNYPKNLYRNSVFHFRSNSLAAITNQTRSFPPGEYSFCFRFVPSNKQGDEYENCFDAMVQPLVPISLLNPAHQDTICMKRPMLNWQPPMPFQSAMRFRLLLVEKKQAKAAESMLMNTPLLLLDNISSTAINYPSGYPDLQEGKTYCWQVVAYNQKTILSTSEIWEFTVQCREAVKSAPTDSYRELKLLVNGNYYIANNYLKFSFYNYYSVKKLRYDILDVENGNAKIEDLPEIKIQQGHNKIDIDLAEIGLKNGKNYILRVYPFNEPDVEVRFTYKED